MLSPLRPLLCRHDYYWSERHRSERCRHCGKTQAVQADPEPFVDALTAASEARRVLDRQPLSEVRPTPSAKVLRAQARDRRETLLVLLDQLASGEAPSRRQAIDAVLAVIEDAHSAEPVLFGSGAASHFARLHEARSVPES